MEEREGRGGESGKGERGREREVYRERGGNSE